ncbi:c-type cytochrome [Thioclava sp. BHET1]|nr:c-type cytochrome [Thioclava sp. BHET1]
MGLMAGLGLTPQMMPAADAAATQAAASESVSQGQYLATAGDCAACHTAPGGKPYAGGLGIDSPLGKIYASNITPSKTDGIGAYSEAEFARALRQGIARDGTHLYPAMPYTSYAKLTDQDVAALYAYFMKDVQPVDAPAPQTALPFPFSQRWLMAGWNLMFLDDHPFQPDSGKSAEWNRGAYLAQGLAHCSTCHTPRNAMMAEESGARLTGASLGTWYAPNITSDPKAGIGSWSEAQIVQYLKTGSNGSTAQAAGPMAEAVEHSFQNLSDADLKAIAVWLKTVPDHSGAGTQASRDSFGAPQLATEASLRGVADPTDNGFRVYSGSCAACHQASGGGNPYYPALYHNSATGAQTPDNLISAIVYGVQLTAGGTAHAMPAFGPKGTFSNRLTDQDIVDVSNYVLQHFGNPALTVTLADVERIKAGGAAPLIAKFAPLAVPLMIIAALLVLLAIGLIWSRSRRHAALR